MPRRREPELCSTAPKAIFFKGELGVEFRPDYRVFCQEFNVGREISAGNRIFRLYASVKGREPVQAAGGAAVDLQVRCQFVPTHGRVQEQILMDYIIAGGQGPTLGNSA